MSTRASGLLGVWFIALVCVVPASLHAAQIHVPGQFVVLQDAVDAALSGDVIVIDGGTHAPVVIDKPLTLVGVNGNRPLIESPAGIDVPCVSLAGSGRGAVTLANIHFDGETDGSVFSQSPPVIAGSGFDALHLLHCDVQPFEWVFLTGLGAAETTVSVAVPFLLVQDSVIVGGQGGVDFAFDFTPPGAPAIEASGDVAIFDSVVQGGAGADDVMPYDLIQSAACSELGGKGATGVVAGGTLYRSGSLISGGAGASIWAFIAGFGSFPFCIAAAGADVDVGTVVDFPGDLMLASGPMIEGANFQLAFSAFPDTLLLIGLAPSAPQSVGPGLLFTDPNLMLAVPIPLFGVTVLTLPIPSDPGAAGAVLCFQTYSSFEGLSRPVFAAYLPD